MRFDCAKKIEIPRRRRRAFKGFRLPKRQLNKESYEWLSKRNKEFVHRAKMKPCVDCKKQYNPWVMQFDHLNPQEKKYEISKMSCYSVKTIMAEIEKCDVVCANCHSERTYMRKHYLLKQPQIETPVNSQLDLL